MLYDAIRKYRAGEKKPIPAVVACQGTSTFSVTAAIFTLYLNGTPITGLTGLSILGSFPVGQTASPAGYYNLDTSSGNPTGQALTAPEYDATIQVAGTGSDGQPYIFKFRYLVKILPSN